MQAKSIKGNSPKEINSALVQCLTDGFIPTLAIMFISVKQDREAVCEILHKEGIDIFGATSCGEFVDGYQDEGSIAILLLDLNREFYTILFEDIAERNLSEVSSQLTHTALQKFKRPAFILCSTSISAQSELIIDGETLVRSIEKVVGPQVNIDGGMAGDDWSLSGTYVFTYGKSTDSGIVALILDEDKIDLHGMAISGWKPIGISRTVTKSEGRLLYAIDDQPALDMYLKYLGGETMAGDSKYKMFEEIGVHYPFQVEREIGAPALVSPMEINKEENALLCESPIPQGAKLQFSMSPDFDIAEKMLDKANDLKTKSNAKAEAMLIFSCAGRLNALGPMAQEENEGLYKIWNAPMAGFYTYGEYGKGLKGKHEFHSTTCSWVAIKEK